MDSECLNERASDLLHLQQNDRAMVRQICRVKPEDMASVRSSELLARLGIDDFDTILWEKRLRWFGHVARSGGAINNVFNMKKEGGRQPGRPKMTWKAQLEKDQREWGLRDVNPLD
ncbi:uncharacterized protein LOC125678897 [Ostrea edulis]|uniref:uncharacterized protein LOC125678897 n=1 Tax=Ostrea edulis TaxID=37623 RepID=UPI0024AF8EC8|nr:uncharacterized protein LOC125678897 [Ostrea edulis]